MFWIGREKINDIWILIYIFIAIFQPQIIPVTTIYLMGAVTFFLLLIENHKRNIYYIFYKSGMRHFYMFCIGMMFYLCIVSTINIIWIDSRDMDLNRAKCVNQLLVLTGIQLMSIVYVLSYFTRRRYPLKKLQDFIIYAGLMQGGCAILAYLFPDIRSFFLRYGGDLYNNSYFLARRGYGFSSMLIDVFGYGMGLIAGLILLKEGFTIRRKIFLLIPVMFSILVNARTGILVVMVGGIIYILRSKKSGIIFLKIFGGLICILIGFIKVIPIFLNWGMNQSNVTIVWITSAFKQVYDAIIAREFDLSSFSFISNFGTWPENSVALLFGSGHSVYGLYMYHILGFHSDVGYVNWIWIYGIFGMTILLLLYLWLFIKAYRCSDTYENKSIMIFQAVCFFLVMIKGNLLGYNPGTCVMYFISFATIYYHNVVMKSRGR